MRNNLIDLIRKLKPWKNNISITTNGTIHNKYFFRKLYKEGVDIINVSLDSSDADKHNKQRGKSGSFEEVLKTLAVAKSVGLKVNISTVVTKETVKSKGLTDLLTIARKFGARLHPNFVVPQGRYHGSFSKLLNKDEIKWMKEFMIKNKDVSRDLNYNYVHQYGCPAVKETIYITPYGDVLPCPFIQVSLGNLKSKSLISTIKVGLKSKYFSKYSTGCLASENRKFISNYMKKICNAKETPVPFAEVFKK